MEHLTDEQLSALLDGMELEEPVSDHLLHCDVCRREHKSLQDALGLMRADVAARADRPAGFWKWQVEVVLGRTRPASPKFVSALASGMALVVASLLLLLGSEREVGKVSAVPSVPAAEATPMSDAEILAEVERTLRAAPESLQPAALIAEELLLSSQRQPVTKNRKEKGDEI